jgi:hypothetical protein
MVFIPMLKYFKLSVYYEDKLSAEKHFLGEGHCFFDNAFIVFKISAWLFLLTNNILHEYQNFLF